MALNSPGSYKRYLEQEKQEQPKKKAGLLQSLLEDLSRPFVRTGKTLGGGAYEIARGATAPFTNYDKRAQAEVSRSPDILQNLLASFQESKNPFYSQQDLEQIEQNPLGAILDQVKQSAALASYGIPFGKGANLLTKFAVPGATVGGAQELSRPGATPTSVAQSAALGGVTSSALGGLLNIPGLLSKGGKRGATILGEKAASSNLRLTGAQFKKASESGFDPRKVFQKLRYTGNYENQLSSLSDDVAKAESQIQNSIKLGGKTLKLSGDDVIKALASEQRSLSKGLDSTKAKALGKIIEDAKARFGKGLTPKQALEFKRYADNKFGRAVVEEETGAVTGSAQKVIANVFRKKLKSMFPEIKEALDKESALLTLKPILQNAQASASAEGLTAGLTPLGAGGAGFFLGGPLGAALGIAGGVGAKSPRVVSQLAKVGGEGVQQIAGQPSRLAGVGRQVAQQVSSRVPSALMGDLPQEETGQETIDLEQLLQQGGQTQLSDQGLGLLPSDQSISQEVNPFPLEKFIEFASKDPKNADYYKYVFEQYQQQYAAPKEKPFTSATAKDFALVESGSRSLEELEGLLAADKNILLKRLVPGKFLTRQYEATAFNVADTVLRLRTGATAPEEEIRRYMKNVIPQFGDDDKTVKSKMDRIRKDLSETSALIESSRGGEQDVLMQILQQSGYQQ